MSEKQILLFNENYLGPITRISGENEKIVSSFFNSMINLTRHTVDKESFQKGLLLFVNKIFVVSPSLRTEFIL